MRFFCLAGRSGGCVFSVLAVFALQNHGTVDFDWRCQYEFASAVIDGDVDVACLFQNVSQLLLCRDSDVGRDCHRRRAEDGYKAQHHGDDQKSREKL